jgi:biopolymer transport protein TolQ
LFAPLSFFQISITQSVLNSGPVSWTVLGILLVLSVLSWTIIFAKWKRFSAARAANTQFLRAFRKAPSMEAIAVSSEQFRLSPLVTVFDFGYDEVGRQVKSRGTLTNKLALERTLQLGISEEVTRLERSMNWLATTATVSPFIGLLGTVWGIINAFGGLAEAGSASLRAVAPGISDALVATAMGLIAAIPAAVFYNYFGTSIREFGTRMEDFSLEFMNLTERSFGD